MSTGRVQQLIVVDLPAGESKQQIKTWLKSVCFVTFHNENML